MDQKDLDQDVGLNLLQLLGSRPVDPQSYACNLVPESSTTLGAGAAGAGGGGDDRQEVGAGRQGAGRAEGWWVGLRGLRGGGGGQGGWDQALPTQHSTARHGAAQHGRAAGGADGVSAGGSPWQ